MYMNTIIPVLFHDIFHYYSNILSVRMRRHLLVIRGGFGFWKGLAVGLSRARPQGYLM